MIIIYCQKLSLFSLNVGGKLKQYIVYSSDTIANRVLTVAYELGSADMVQAVARCLRNIIAEA